LRSQAERRRIEQAIVSSVDCWRMKGPTTAFQGAVLGYASSSRVGGPEVLKHSAGLIV
jgi:hypothetical protein